jgi:hypothetical protein
MNPLVVLAKIRISVPPEAVVPLLIGIGVLLVLVFAGAALANWKAKHPALAAKVGLIIALVLSAYVVYMGALLMPNRYIDLGPPGHPPISLADGPIMGFLGVIATVLWRFANQRWIALGFGVIAGAALVLKPFVLPVVLHFSSDSQRAPGLADPDTLSLIGPGIAMLIAGLVAGRGSGR